MGTAATSAGVARAIPDTSPELCAGGICGRARSSEKHVRVDLDRAQFEQAKEVLSRRMASKRLHKGP
jgi:hypothetical protein